MLRYLQRAFWATVRLPGLGRVPFNVMYVAAVFALGFVRELRPIWIFGAALEMVYLYFLASNARFQKMVDAEDLAAEREDPALQRQRLTQQLAKPARDRLAGLERKCSSAIDIAHRNGAEPYATQSQKDGLDRLGWIYLKLLLARQMLNSHEQTTGETSVRIQLEKLQTELAYNQLPPTVRESKLETQRILERRLELLSRRTQTTSEIDADLARIEAEVDLAVENAALGPAAMGVGGSVKLATSMLESDLFGSSRNDVESVDQSFGGAREEA